MKYANRIGRADQPLQSLCLSLFKFKLRIHGQLWIGKRKKLNPDFIEANGKKICVETMGNYWHSPLLNKKLREDALLSYRKKHYTRYHWKSVFIWGIDLLREDAEDFVLSELRKL